MNASESPRKLCCINPNGCSYEPFMAHPEDHNPSILILDGGPCDKTFEHEYVITGRCGELARFRYDVFNPYREDPYRKDRVGTHLSFAMNINGKDGQPNGDCLLLVFLNWLPPFYDDATVLALIARNFNSPDALRELFIDKELNDEIEHLFEENAKNNPTT